MMDCDKALLLLSDYLEGNLDPNLKRDIELLLEKDPGCRDIFESAKANRISLQNLDKVKTSSEFDVNLRQRIIEYNQSEKKPVFNAKKGISLAFTGTAVIAALYFYIFTDFSSQSNNPSEKQLLPSSTFANPAGQDLNKEKMPSAVETETTIDNAALNHDSLNNAPQKIDEKKINLTGQKKN